MKLLSARPTLGIASVTSMKRSPAWSFRAMRIVAG
jgi:hypothetical protein